MSAPTGAPDPLTPLRDARLALDRLLAQPDTAPTLQRIAAQLAATIRSGGKIMICGNGGSACDAMHFAEELTGRFRADRAPMAALACTDPGHITCTANDYGFDEVFARWVTALGTGRDTLIVLSTSGDSPNLVKAVQAAQRRALRTVALLGRAGGTLKGACNLELIVPGQTSDRIQELHMLVLHALVEALEPLVA